MSILDHAVDDFLFTLLLIVRLWAFENCHRFLPKNFLSKRFLIFFPKDFYFFASNFSPLFLVILIFLSPKKYLLSAFHRILIDIFYYDFWVLVFFPISFAHFQYMTIVENLIPCHILCTDHPDSSYILYISPSFANGAFFRFHSIFHLFPISHSQYPFIFTMYWNRRAIQVRTI